MGGQRQRGQAAVLPTFKGVLRRWAVCQGHGAGVAGPRRGRARWVGEGEGQAPDWGQGQAPTWLLTATSSSSMMVPPPHMLVSRSTSDELTASAVCCGTSPGEDCPIYHWLSCDDLICGLIPTTPPVEESFPPPPYLPLLPAAC